jgi:hypothetical protein
LKGEGGTECLAILRDARLCCATTGSSG